MRRVAFAIPISAIYQNEFVFGRVSKMAAEIRSLTGVRGIGAALIVVYHFGKTRLDWVHPIWPVPHGYMAVDLFFMLRGFGIGLAYRYPFSAPFLKHYS